MSRGGRLRRGSEPTRTTNLDGIFTLNECADYIAEDKWPTIPDAVSDLAVTGGDGTLDLSWSAPSSNGLPFSLYVIEYTPSGGSATTVTTSNTSYQITGLTNDTEYSVRVGAIIGDRVNYGAVVTGTPVAVVVFDLSTLLIINNEAFEIDLRNNPELDNGGADISPYNFQQMGWQLQSLDLLPDDSLSGPFPVQLPSNSSYEFNLTVGSRVLTIFRLFGKIGVRLQNPTGCDDRWDVTNIVLEKVTDGVVTHRLGPIGISPLSNYSQC